MKKINNTMGCNCKSKTVSTQPIKQVTKPTTTTNSPAKRVVKRTAK